MRTTVPGFSAVYQSAPSGPAAIPSGFAMPVGSGKSVLTPAGVMRPIMLDEYSVYQRLPSLPLAIAFGPSLVRRDSSGVASGVVAGIRPIALVTLSVNHNAPSGPPTMWVGLAVALASGLLRIVPLASMRLTVDGPWLTNQTAPSLPAAMPYGKPGTGACSVSVPSIVIRPILCPLRFVNHNAPSCPAVIA